MKSGEYSFYPFGCILVLVVIYVLEPGTLHVWKCIALMRNFVKASRCPLVLGRVVLGAVCVR